MRIGHMEDSSLVAKPIGRIRQVVCASLGYIQQYGEPRVPQELQNKTCLRTTGMAGGHHWHFWQNGKSFSVTVKESLVCNLAASTVAACVNGLGYGLFMSDQVQSEIQQGKLKVVLEDFAPPSLPVNIIFPHARLLSTRVRSFVDWIARLKDAEFLRQTDRLSA